MPPCGSPGKQNSYSPKAKHAATSAAISPMSLQTGIVPDHSAMQSGPFGQFRLLEYRQSCRSPLQKTIRKVGDYPKNIVRRPVGNGAVGIGDRIAGSIVNSIANRIMSRYGSNNRPIRKSSSEITTVAAIAGSSAGIGNIAAGEVS